MLYVLNIMVRYSLIYVGTKDRQYLTFIPSFDLLFYANHSNVASMKQSIRLTRAKLYFKFIAFRVLTSVRAGATPQRMFEKWKRHGETDVKVLPWSQGFFLIFWAFIVHCNASINSNGAHHPPSSSPSPATAEHLLTLSVRGCGISKFYRGPGAGH